MRGPSFASSRVCSAYSVCADYSFCPVYSVCSDYSGVSVCSAVDDETASSLFRSFSARLARA